MANVELCIKPVLQANIVDQKREAVQTNETLKSSEIMVKSRCSNLTNKHDPCTSGPLQLILILILEEWAHQPPKCFLFWSCGAVRQELHVRQSGRKADDLQTSKLRNVDSVDSGPWLRSPPTLWRRGLGVSVAMTGTDPASQPASNPLLFWMRNDVVWLVKCLWNVFAKIGLRSQIFRNSTTRVQDSEDSWGVYTGHGT